MKIQLLSELCGNFNEYGDVHLMSMARLRILNNSTFLITFSNLLNPAIAVFISQTPRFSLNESKIFVDCSLYLLLCCCTCYSKGSINSQNICRNYVDAMQRMLSRKYLIRTHLAYIANVKKSCYTKQQSHSFESARQLTSFNHWKVMKSDVSNGVRRCNVVLTLERHEKPCKRSRNSPAFGGISSIAMAESPKKLKSSNVILSFIVCSNRNRSAAVRELLSNNSLFIGQLYEDKSLALRARDSIFFTTDLQTVNYYSTIHC